MTFLYNRCDTFIYIDDREILISPSEIKKNPLLLRGHLFYAGVVVLEKGNYYTYFKLALYSVKMFFI
jgi:hypothetical protein